MPDGNVACARDGADSHVLHLRAELVGKHIHYKARTGFSQRAQPVEKRPPGERRARPERQCAQDIEPAAVRTSGTRSSDAFENSEFR
jgi:hypothetical protein